MTLFISFEINIDDMISDPDLNVHLSALKQSVNNFKTEIIAVDNINEQTTSSSSLRRVERSEHNETLNRIMLHVQTNDLDASYISDRLNDINCISFVNEGLVEWKITAYINEEYDDLTLEDERVIRSFLDSVDSRIKMNKYGTQALCFLSPFLDEGSLEKNAMGVLLNVLTN